MTKLNRARITVTLSPEALKLLDAECQRRGWQRPQVLDLIITEYFKQQTSQGEKSDDTLHF